MKKSHHLPNSIFVSLYNSGLEVLEPSKQTKSRQTCSVIYLQIKSLHSCIGKVRVSISIYEHNSSRDETEQSAAARPGLRWRQREKRARAKQTD